ncbi:hypothetical protein ASD22_12520 [Rhodanobacter sp. Root480]|uniref:hypothetical protein n=1 Tax=Rhodanobacter sp. Root480 TaxID=1736542 RepID=UPI0006FBC3E3|nr:hypothetical protein [Rhodanobacter sp. Root480]KQX98011.1 hypothetical protein ASD22_12520 [Rhodanobacter sp. Root480]
MSQFNKTTRFFSVMLVAGGGVGVAMVMILGLKLLPQGWLLLVPLAGLAALFAWAAFTGIRLWQGTPYGRRWAPILFASQIPMFSLQGIRYQWFTGAELSPTVQLGTGSVPLGLSVNLGANGQFFFGDEAAELFIGLNLFAVVALVLLLRANSSFKRRLATH